MQILFVLSLLFAILVALFAVMNSDPVTIKLLWKQYEFSQAIVILASAAIGAVIVAFLGLFSKIKSTFRIRELQGKIKKLEKNIEELKANIPEEKSIDLIDETGNVELENINEEKTNHDNNNTEDDTKVGIEDTDEDNELK